MNKLNLHYGTNLREDFKNIDIRKDPNLSYLCKDEQEQSVDEIIANVGCLESMHRAEIKLYLTRWFNLLAPDGAIKVYLNDIYVMCNNLVYNRFSLQAFEQEMLANQYNSFHDVHTVISELIATGFKIKTVNYHDRIGIIHGTK